MRNSRGREGRTVFISGIRMVYCRYPEFRNEFPLSLQGTPGGAADISVRTDCPPPPPEEEALCRPSVRAENGLLRNGKTGKKKRKTLEIP